ncbi:ATP-binding protein [Streptomyces chrestomyceticus]|uniref:ATP-binding protein n=1 Tax=Streptomyces chrestomyceticus TaxID=68185 RepID=A0ABU7WQS2_9ACTN
MSREELIRTFSPHVADAVTRPFEIPLLTHREGWDTGARRLLAAPDLADSAPKGTPVGPRDPRLMYHAEMLPVITPALRRGLHDARRQLRKNRFSSVGRATNMIIDGDRGCGKTTLLVQIGRGYQGLIETDLGPDANRIPVIYITVPSERESTLHWSLPFAEFLGLNHTLNPTDRTRRPSDMTEPVTHVMHNARARLVLVDGLDRLADNEIHGAFDYFETLQDRTRATFVYCGTGAADIVHEARYGRRRKNLPNAVKGTARPDTQPVLWAGAIDYGDDWHSVVKGFDDDLRLYDHIPGTLVKMSRYLHKRTGGYINTLNDLICTAAQDAIETGTETITRPLLDTIRTGRHDTW